MQFGVRHIYRVEIWGRDFGVRHPSHHNIRTLNEKGTLLYLILFNFNT